MNTAAVRTLMHEAHQCAMAMLDNGTYIQRELPNVRMDDATRVYAAELCSQLIGTKHDILHELYELDELLRAGATDARVASAARLIIRWLRNDIEQMHRLVTTLEAAARKDPECGSAYVLVAESAANILKPFARAKAAADLLTDADATGSA